MGVRWWDKKEVKVSSYRRFEKRIYIPLPDEPARIKLFQKHVGSTQNSLNYNDFATFASMTDGYSGADISIIVREALMEPIRKVQTSTHFKLVSGPSPTDPKVIVKDLYTPCPPSDKKGFEMKWMDIPDDKLLLPSVSSRDILKAISRIRPTVSPEECEKLIKFSKEFGGDL
uniref:Vacuolar protein sorting-associated protein 4B (Trinotate prediction) n=1 Tax=Myxobolus squamalis TaxID=59785 RepID=A0A6B2G071_MYXSQ